MNNLKAANSISIDDLNRLLKTGRGPLLLDTLPQSRYQQKHLPSAENTCVFEMNFLEQVANISTDKNRSIVIYGVNEQTHDAKIAAEKLLRDEYTQVSVLTGGLAAWQSAGYPLEGDSKTMAVPQPAMLADGTYQVDTEASVIEWAGRNPNSTHWGTLRLSSGDIQIEAGQIRGNFTIKMNSIQNVNLAEDELQPVLESHLKSDDFFFVKLFPEAGFEMVATPTAEAQSVSVPNYEVTGQLQLCGVSAEQTFSATIVPTDDGHITAEAHFDFDRTRWGVIYGSTRFFEYLGMHLVFDQISLQLRILTK